MGSRSSIIQGIKLTKTSLVYLSEVFWFEFTLKTFLFSITTALFDLKQGLCLYLPRILVKYHGLPCPSILVTWALVDLQQGAHFPSLIMTHFKKLFQGLFVEHAQVYWHNNLTQPNFFNNNFETFYCGNTMLIFFILLGYVVNVRAPINVR